MITGLGLPGIAVPIMATFLGVEQAVMIMVLPTLITNLWLTWRLRDCYREVPELPRIAVAGVPGHRPGSHRPLSRQRTVSGDGPLVVGASRTWYCGSCIRKAVAGTGKARTRLAPPVGFASGTLQGATGICAPVIVPYVDALGANPRTYVFIFSAVFMSLSLTHLVVLGTLQAYTPLQFGQSVLAVVPAMLFVSVGNWLRQFIRRPELFSVIIRAVLFVTAARLLYGAWSG